MLDKATRDRDDPLLSENSLELTAPSALHMCEIYDSKNEETFENCMEYDSDGDLAPVQIHWDTFHTKEIIPGAT